MKKIIVIALMAVLVSATQSFAQAKFGHIDMTALISVMPERAAAAKSLETFTADLEKELGAMQQEYQAKYQEFVQQQDSLSELVRNAKITQIQTMEQNIQQFRMAADQQLQQKQQELMKPIFDKADQTIATVAKENGLVYVFDVSVNIRVVLYKSNDSVDLLPLVKAKMGI